jgi:cytochrome c
MKKHFALMVLALGVSVAHADELLLKKNNCMACHKTEGKLVGPSYKDISKKYKGQSKAAESLVSQIKNGGKGNWGSIPMPPNPNISDADSKAIASWILTR